MQHLTISQALNQGLREAMQEDASVILLGEDVAQYGGTFDVSRGLLEEFGPERVYGTAISEGAILGACVGAALAGFRPIGEIMFMDFLTCAMDQMTNYVAGLTYAYGGQASLPLVIRTTVGTHGGVQHSKSLEAWLTHVPGVRVAMPVTAYDAKGMLTAAIRDNNPAVVIENRHLYHRQAEPVPDEPYVVPFGSADVKRVGADVSLIAWGRPVHYALEAATALEADGIDVEVVDLRSLVPLDMPTVLSSARKTRRVVLVQDAWRSFGVGAEIATRIYDDMRESLEAPIVRIAHEDVHTPYSVVLGRHVKPSAGKIVAAVNAMLDERASAASTAH